MATKEIPVFCWEKLTICFNPNYIRISQITTKTNQLTLRITVPKTYYINENMESLLSSRTKLQANICEISSYLHVIALSQIKVKFYLFPLKS